MLNEEVIKELILAVGTRLKFQNAFAQLSLELKEDEMSNNPNTFKDDVEVVSATKTSATNFPKIADEFIRDQAKIFGLHRKDAQLTNWQEAVNNSAYEIAKVNPDLIYDRGTLKVEAEKKARESYIFQKRSGSRSKNKDMNGNHPPIKRAKISKEDRGEKILEISQELELLKKQIMTKQQIIGRSSAIKDYPQCDKAQTETRELTREKSKLEKLLKELQRKETKSNWYQKSKGKKQLKQGSNTGQKLPPLRDVHSVDIRTLFAMKPIPRNVTSTTTQVASGQANFLTGEKTAEVIDVDETATLAELPTNAGYHPENQQQLYCD